MKLSDDAAIVFHGFLNLPNLEKLALVEAINDYFDSNDREPIRVANDEQFASIDLKACKCCGR
ncbi:MAG TPA: hypothetical protein VJL58_03980 [Pyrinomonadaceae bacterium]|nr:hypothetical protein [Pyrinomonadaceae bacterium]